MFPVDVAMSSSDDVAIRWSSDLVEDAIFSRNRPYDSVCRLFINGERSMQPKNYCIDSNFQRQA